LAPAECDAARLHRPGAQRIRTPGRPGDCDAARLERRQDVHVHPADGPQVRPALQRTGECRERPYLDRAGAFAEARRRISRRSVRGRPRRRDGYHAGRTPHISGIRVRGRTISFTLTAPSRSFLARLSQPFFCTLPADTLALEGGFPEVATPSAGPYYMSDRFNGEYMILKRNPNYAGPAPARFDAIAFREGLAPEKAVARVKSGEWDGALLDDSLLGPGQRRRPPGETRVTAPLRGSLGPE